MSNVLELVESHERWRFNECINLIPSENITSEAVRRILASDLGHRYSLRRVECLDFSMEYDNFYRGTRFIDSIVDYCRELACKLFNCNYAMPEPLSGHHAAMMVLATLCSRGDVIMAISEDKGGYPGYMSYGIPSCLGLRYEPIPFDDSKFNIDYDVLEEVMEKVKPKLLILGASTILFPYDIRRVRRLCDRYGTILVYDASHVLGLIAGGVFQENPLGMGVDVLYGSTHKTLFGPQGGLILVNDHEIYGKLMRNTKLKWLDNPHLNRIAALAKALEELLEHGRVYARNVTINAKELARALEDEDVPVMYRDLGYTESHQILVDTVKVENKVGLKYYMIAEKLERVNIIVDNSGRMGTQEVTRLGMGCKEMRYIAKLISDVVHSRRDLNSIRDDVIRFRIKFTNIHYA